ncbi:MAG: hypothetical protein WCP85_31305 [Mariniphaga sp.]
MLKTPANNIFQVAPQTFKRVALSVRREFCTFLEIRSQTIFVVAILPWVARSKWHLSYEMAFVRGRLPRAIHVYPLSGMGFEKDFKRFTKV